MSVDINNLRVDNRKTYSFQHDFTHNRYTTIVDVSMPLFYCQSQWSTTHSIYWNGIVATVGVAHNRCPQGQDPDIISCDNVDLSIKSGCPASKKILNITSLGTLRHGDEAVSAGFIDWDLSRLWHGVLTGIVSTEVKGSKGTHFAGPDKMIVREDEFVLHGVQHDGMSGSAAANGCGYVGVAHARHINTAVPLALVIPARHVVNCLRRNMEKLSTLAECGRSDDVISVNVLPFDICNYFDGTLVSFAKL